VAAIAVMGIYHGVNSEVIANPEEVLPVVLLEYFPIGIKGLLIAGLIAAAMSTFDSVVNAGAAYWVKDLYQRFIRPQATDAQMVGQARLASTILVVMGTLFTFFFTSLNDVWGWLTMGLGVGLIVPQFIRWYWWRFNGWGYAGGTLAGMVVAIGQRLIAPELGELNVFFLTAGITFIVSIAVALATAPVEQSVTEGFFRQTKPFGFWGPARSALSSAERRAIHQENRRDALNMFLAVAWQLSLFLTLMMPVVGRLDITGWLAAATLSLSVALYFTWYRHLSPTA
jgi:Na+/proline symporter